MNTLPAGTVSSIPNHRVRPAAPELIDSPARCRAAKSSGTGEASVSFASQGAASHDAACPAEERAAREQREPGFRGRFAVTAAT
jgi:hypothetical protein